MARPAKGTSELLGKWLIGALTVSVVVNLLLAGFIAGRMSGDIGFRGGMGAAPKMPQLGFLDEERRREVSQGLEARRELRTNLRELRRSQRDIRAAFEAEPFDQEALSAALAEFRQRLEESQALSHGKLVAVAVRLTPDERRRMARTLDRRPKHPDKRPPRREHQ